MAKPLRSITITVTSTLIRACPSLCDALILSALQDCCLCLSLAIVTTGSRSSTQKPGLSSRHLYAGRHLASKQVSARFILQQHKLRSFDAIWSVSTLERWFTCVRLLNPHLILTSTFSLTLTTMALYHSSLRWFTANSCKSAVGGLLPSSTPLATAHLYPKTTAG